MKRRAIAATVLVIAVCTSAVWSQARPGGAGPGVPMVACPAIAAMAPRSPIVGRMAKTLQLTKDQSAKLKRIMDDGEQTQAALARKYAASSRALRSALLAPSYNPKTVKALAVKAEQAEASSVSASIDTWTQIRVVLSKTQVSKLQKAMSMQEPRPGGPPLGAGYPPPPPGR